MPVTNFANSLKLVLAHEGGYVNHPRDPGGATNKGVTQSVYDAYRAIKGLKKRSVRNIETAEVNAIYKTRYWDLAHCDELPAGIDYATFDYAVNSGVGKSVKDLQRTVNEFGPKQIASVFKPLKVDGVIGDDTIEAVKACCHKDEVGFIELFCDRRLRFLKSLKTWGTFGKGWNRRVEEVRHFATEWAKGDLEFPIRKAEMPKAIGSAPAEAPAPGKALGSGVSVLKTASGIGAAMAGAGVSGQTMITAAETARSHVGETFIGQAAFIAFLLLIIGGVGLILFKFFEERKEKAGAA